MRIAIFFIAILFLLAPLKAQENSKNQMIQLSYSEAKDRMLKENLKVLSEYYNISIAQANLEQSKLWNNPYFVWNADMYSVEQDKYFNFSNQKLIQLEYVFSVSGKRIRAIKGAKLDVEASKLAYSDVVRGLMLEFSNSFTNLNSLLEKRENYNLVMNHYQNLLSFFKKEYELGMISQSELLRLNSEYIALKSESINNENQLAMEQSNLNQLLNFPEGTFIIPKERSIEKKSLPNVMALIDSAKAFRPDYLLAQNSILAQQNEVKLQKSMAFPDLKLAYQPHDKGSNYVRPYSGMVFEMSVPIFNRNQGGIHAAKFKAEQSVLDYQLMDNRLTNEIASSYSQWLNNQKALEQFNPEMFKQVEDLLKGATENFQKKHISFLEYVDYQRSFLQLKLLYIDHMNNYLQSVNNINFSVGKEITN